MNARQISDLEQEAKRCAGLAAGYRLAGESGLGAVYGRAAGALSLALEAVVLADVAAAQAKEQAA